MKKYLCWRLFICLPKWLREPDYDAKIGPFIGQTILTVCLSRLNRDLFLSNSGKRMSSPPPSTSASSSSDGPGLTGNAGNYFYGFLVTFVGLLLIFVSCGINIRRRMRERRNLWLGFTVTMGETTFLPSDEEQEEPDFYEPKFVNNANPSWAEVMVSFIFNIVYS